MRCFSSFLIMWTLLSPARAVEPMDVGQLQLELDKLGTLGSVLYVAAHPDDENTKLLAYLANERRLETTYLSLTRGDGGQNLLGADLGEKLGLIRTQELIAARRLDGAKQRFSRAVDFGFSKTPEETLRIWGREAILADLVWTIRSTRPDVIITRFSMEPGHTHGHHTAATLLAKEAFEAAADPARFPEQLATLEPWAAKRLLWNTSHWFYSRRNIEFDSSGLLAVDTGGYNPLLGQSYSEIAARSRSRHQSQGFGSTAELGQSMEYFEHLAGGPAEDDLFEGVNTTWERLPQSDAVAEALRRAGEAFSPREPARAVPDLIEAHRALSALPDSFWQQRKLHDLERVLAACLALDIESVSAGRSAVPGGGVELTFNAVQRSPYAVAVRFRTAFDDVIDDEPVVLERNRLHRERRSVRLPNDFPISQPFWLLERGEYGRYALASPELLDEAHNPPSLPVVAEVTVNGYTLRYTLPTRFKFNDPVRGEVNEPFTVTPPVMVNLPESPLILSGTRRRPITARVIAAADVADGRLRLSAGDGWRVEPAEIPFQAKAGEELSFSAELVAPEAGAGEAVLAATVRYGGESYGRGYERIEYEHIPAQTIFPRAEARVVALDVKTSGERVGYVPGAGDAVPEALQRIGYAVDILGEAEMDANLLGQYDAIVLGIRALNTNERIGFLMPALFDYAAAGGVVVFQYNTNRSMQTEAFSPYPLTLSRDRVTDETAEMRVLAPKHPVLNYPNRIGPADFEGWVQERGLYFPSAWDAAFTPIVSVNDPDEPPSEGSLLVARHGEGWFVYSGLSWFRQLPAGVPGAYRLFANLVSLGGSTGDE